MTWISTEEAMKALGVKRRWLFALIRRGEMTTRAGAKSVRGKPRREILLESLPPEAQARYLDLIHAPGRNGEVSNGEYLSPADGAFVPRQSDDSGATPLVSPLDRAPSVTSALKDASEQTLRRHNKWLETIRQIESATNRRDAIRAAARKHGVSDRTVERRLKNWTVLGASPVVRKKRSDAGGPKRLDGRVIAKIKLGYLQPYRPTITQVHEEIARDFETSGLPAPNYQQTRRVCKSIDPDLVAGFRIGDREFDDKFAIITRRKKPALPRLWVDADHHQWDHYVIFANDEIGRPWMTVIQDICTNEILGYRLTREARSTYPGSDAIAATLRMAVLKKADPAWPSFGLFEKFYADLGKDFRSQHVRAVAHDLNMQIVHTRGYHGKSKPIERWFGVSESMLKKLPGYCGKDTHSNPERQRIGAPRSFEEMRGELLTIEKFEAELRKWVVDVFHHTDSRALKGLSPLAALEQHVKAGWAPREIKDERVLDLLLMRRKAKKVQRWGIEMFGTAGHPRAFIADALTGLVGQEVEVFYDPQNIGELIVYKDDRFLCKAQNRELLDFGASEKDLQREREIKAQQKKSVRERHRQLLIEAQYPDPLARAQAEKRLEKVEQREREKLAVNAQASSVPVLIPKYASAAKKLSLVKPIGAESGGPRFDPLADLPTIEEMLPGRTIKDEFDDLPPSDSYFKRPATRDEFDDLPPSDFYIKRAPRRDDDGLLPSDELFKAGEISDWPRELEREEDERSTNCASCKEDVGIITRYACRYCQAIFCADCAEAHRC